MEEIWSVINDVLTSIQKPVRSISNSIYNITYTACYTEQILHEECNEVRCELYSWLLVTLSINLYLAE